MAEKLLSVELATPDHKQNIGEALSCTAPGVLGKFQVLPGHTSFISELGIGEVKVALPEATRFYAVAGGFLEVLQNRVLLLLDTAEAAEDIDVARAQEAKDRAENRLANKSTGNIDVTRAEAALARAINRLKVAQHAST